MKHVEHKSFDDFLFYEGEIVDCSISFINTENFF